MTTFESITDFPPDVRALVEPFGGDYILITAERLAQRHFPNALLLGFRRVCEPETGENLIVLSLSVPEAGEDFIPRCNAWYRDWEAAVPEAAWDVLTLSLKPE